MIDKKKVNVVLIACVGLIWCVVGYKYVQRFFWTPQALQKNEANPFAEHAVFKGRDTFELATLGRNPFASGDVSKPVHIVASSHTSFFRPQSKPIAAPKVVPPLPEVLYFGYLKSSAEKDEKALLKINGKLVNMKPKESKDGVSVSRIFKDSVVIGWYGKKVTVRRR